VVAAPRAATESLIRWCSSALDVALFSAGLFERLGALIPFDGAFLATVDPATLLYTRAFRSGMPLEASPAFVRSELGDDDVNQLRQLVRMPTPIGWLDEATHGDRAAARRYREAMAPFGLGDELRVALLTEGTCWGLLCLHLAQAQHGFDARAAANLTALAPHVARALRRALISERAMGAEMSTVMGTVMGTVTADGPGVVLLAPDGAVRSSTMAGDRWFAELAELDGSPAGEVPTVVRSVVERVKAAGPVSAGAWARVRAPSGAWLTVHASQLDDVDASVAVVVEPTSPIALAPLIIAAYALTPRESEVTRRLLAGLPRKAIASELQISPHTVNDHIKVVFDKTGVSSAGQLREQIFHQRLVAGPG
jgi:DNA-binding CsgD family transcriptional regulator